MADNNEMVRQSVVAFLRHVCSRRARWRLSDIWKNGHGDWRYSEDAKCWLVGSVDSIPRAICLGDRYAHADYGADSYGILWSGSTPENWHGYHFDDMGKALEFVRGTRFVNFGPVLWSGLNHESSLLARKYAR